MSKGSENGITAAEQTNRGMDEGFQSHDTGCCQYLLAKPSINTVFSNTLVDLLGGMVSTGHAGSFNQIRLSLPNLNSSAIERMEEENRKRKQYNWTGKTVLIAEDEETNFLFLRAVLSKTGLRILHARTGKEAVEIVASNEEIHLILMDIKMPVMNGLDATLAIKTMNKPTKVIAQTAYTMEEERMKYYKAGCIDFLAKPIQRDVLLETLSKYL